MRQFTAIVPSGLLLLLSLAQPLAAESAQGSPTVDEVHDHLAFLVGSWIGDGLDGVTEEVWLEPADGQMMGLFRLLKDGELEFSEILTIGEFDGRIELRLKHFDDQLHGWEEKDDVVSFPFESMEDGIVRFRGLDFVREGDDGMRIDLVLGNGERTWTEVFRYRRR